MPLKLLNLGCGYRYHSDWTNVDFTSTGPGVLACNLNGALPFDDATFSAVYHSHVLEHFARNRAIPFLSECHRVLKVGGVIRVVVPDLEQIVRSYLAHLEDALKGNPASQHKYDWILMELFDQMVRNVPGGDMMDYWKQDPMPAEEYVISRCGSEVKDYLRAVRMEVVDPADNKQPKMQFYSKFSKIVAAKKQLVKFIQKCILKYDYIALQTGRFRQSGEIHQWMYDRYSLSRLLAASGFTDAKVVAADQSSISEFNSYLLDIEANGCVRKPDSLFMEAKKT